MHDTKRLVAVVLFGLLLLATMRPRPVAASVDFTTPLIITGAVAGAVTLITIIAILGASTDEPREFIAPPRPPGKPGMPSQPRLRMGPTCRTPSGTPALFCW